MADTTETPQKTKKGKGSLTLGFLICAMGAGTGYFLQHNNMLPIKALTVSRANHTETATAAPAGDPIRESTVFVAVPTILVSLGPASDARHLRFTGALEVADGRSGHVTQVMPRIVDILNGYLRAVETSDFDDPAVLGRLRKQMLRRVQLVTASGDVRDFLIDEFILE